jgi:hypothetical protein
VQDDAGEFTNSGYVSNPQSLQPTLGSNTEQQSDHDHLDELSRGLFQDGLHGLLSLRAEDWSDATDTHWHSDFDPALNLVSDPIAGPGLDEFILTTNLALPDMVIEGMSDEKMLFLLQQWRYEVAPWVSEARGAVHEASVPFH